MKASPYLRENRLHDVVAALQFLGDYYDYDLTEEQFSGLFASAPQSATEWSTIFQEHPEFFRKSRSGGDYSLVLRRAKRNDELAKERVAPLTDTELSRLIETAIHFQKHALELQREARWWIPYVIAVVGTLAGTILGALLKAG